MIIILNIHGQTVCTFNFKLRNIRELFMSGLKLSHTHIVCQKNFTSLYFYKICKFCSVAKFNFAKVLPCIKMPMSFMLPAWIIGENNSCEIMKLPLSRKFPGI